VALPPPPNPTGLNPLALVLPAGTELFRVHALERDPRAFNPGIGRPTRFAPLVAGDLDGERVSGRRSDLDGEPDGDLDGDAGTLRVIPTLYAGATRDSVLYESVFHDTPARGPHRRILAARLRQHAISGLRLRRDLALAHLAGPGLARLGLKRADLIDTGPLAYPQTAAWALALHDAPMAPAGLAWTSRLDDRARAYLLFGDRVDGARDLELVAEPVPLGSAAGFELVLRAAQQAGIAVIR